MKYFGSIENKEQLEIAQNVKHEGHNEIDVHNGINKAFSCCDPGVSIFCICIAFCKLSIVTCANINSPYILHIYLKIHVSETNSQEGITLQYMH